MLMLMLMLMMALRRMAVSKMAMGALFEEQYKFALPFNDLQLNDAETAIMCAIMIFNPGNTVYTYSSN